MRTPPTPTPAPVAAAPAACDRCLARTATLARLAGHLDRARDRTLELLALDDAALIAAVGGSDAEVIATEQRDEPALAGAARAALAAAGLDAVCRCAAAYPPGLRALAAPPAVLHIAGDPAWLLRPASELVAIVGSRRPSAYGSAVAASLARGLVAAGLVVLSGLALGIDGSAQRAALDAGGSTVAILAAAPERPYPASARALHARIRGAGAVVSELPPGLGSRRWMFPARNRLIAALAAITIVVEARPGSGALLTARSARELGRVVAAVPGQVGAPLAAGPLELLRTGATLVRGPEDVLEALYGAAARDRAPARPALPPSSQALIDALAGGAPTGEAIARAGLAPGRGLAALAALELDGRIVRGPGGRYVVAP